MTSPSPLLYNTHYHIYNRGNNHAAIFFERENYLFFLRQLRKYLYAQVEIVAYCLMPNHYHLLVHLETENFPQLMQPFLVSYSKAINQRFNRAGTLFEGPFKAIRIEREEYLLALSRYIHLNPVKARLVARAEEWEFSSYRDFIGLRQGTLIAPAAVLAYVPAGQVYREFVESSQEDRQLVAQLGFD